MICVNRKYVPNKGSGESMIKVDCGRCYPCLSNKRNAWTFRMMQETKYSESSLFITLTYDEDHVLFCWNNVNGPNDKFTYEELRENADRPEILNYNTPTLVQEDLVRFNKRLRKAITEDKSLDKVWFKKVEKSGKWAPKYRFYGIGEYGASGDRPHYHIIAWNIPDTWFNWDPVHNQYYSEKLEKVWDKGFIHIGTVTQQSIHYVAKYTLKDIFMGPYETTKAEKPFGLMSRVPGIGHSYINDNIKDYFNNTLDPYATIENNYKYPLSRYYKTRIFEDDGQREELNERARLYCEEKEERQRKQAEKIGISIDDYQETQARAGYNKIKRKHYSNLKNSSL